MLIKITYVFIFIAIIACLYSGYLDTKKSRNARKNNRKNKKLQNNESTKKTKLEAFLDEHSIIIYISLIIVASILYLFKLSSIPAGLNVDEAGIVYDAMSLAKYGVDRYLYHFPVYFINFGGGQNALYTYLTMILIKIFGYNMFVLRIPAAIFGVLSIVFFYKVLKSEKDYTTAILGAFLMLITPFFIMKSRWALESYLFLPFLLFSICAFIKAINTKSKSYFILSGFLFGITLYTYAISYMVLPLFLAVSCIYLLIIKKVNIKNIIFMSIPLAILATPLLLMLAINNGIIPHEITTKFFSIPKLLYYRGGEISFANLKNNLRNLSFFRMMFSNDYLIWNTNPKYGTLYYISIPILVYGLILSSIQLVKSIKKKEFGIDFAMILSFIIMLVLGLLLANLNVNKINCIYLSLIYFTTVGLSHICKNSSKLVIIIIFMYLVLFVKFSLYYFVDYPKEYKDISLFVSDDYNKAIDFAQKKMKKDEKIYVGGVVQPYIYLLIHDKENPYKFKKSVEIKDLITIKYNNYVFTLKEMNEDWTYITEYNSDVYKQVKKLSIKEKHFGKYVVLYK